MSSRTGLKEETICILPTAPTFVFFVLLRCGPFGNANPGFPGAKTNDFDLRKNKLLSSLSNPSNMLESISLWKWENIFISNSWTTQIVRNHTSCWQEHYILPLCTSTLNCILLARENVALHDISNHPGKDHIAILSEGSFTGSVASKIRRSFSFSSSSSSSSLCVNSSSRLDEVSAQFASEKFPSSSSHFPETLLTLSWSDVVFCRIFS